jgi:beta-lactamase regulating signal transducer with metallopeptidase domain
MHYSIQSDSLWPLLKVSCQATALILLVLAAQWAFRRRLSPRWRYSLWLLVIIRLALPGGISSPLSLFNLLSFPALGTSFAETQTTAADGESLGRPPDGVGLHGQPGQSHKRFANWAQSGFRLSWLLALWSAGALTLASFLLVIHFRLSRKFSLRRPLINASVLNLLEDCKQEMGVRVPVILLETPEVGSPALFGFVRPRLLLPAGLVGRFSLQELRYVFLHELGHLKRRDILAGWLMTALQIIHWFNPLVWLAFHRMRIDRELACDALALSYLRAGENQSYGQTIIKLLESFGRSTWAPSLAGTVENRNQIKERINMIATFKKTNRGLALAFALFAGLGLITLTDAQPAGLQAVKNLVGTWVLIGNPENVGLAPAEGGRLKSLTDTHWSITQTDPKNGQVTFHHGGTYTAEGNQYVEHVEFANPNTKKLIGNVSKFDFKIEGDTLTLIGIGNHWREVWKRAASTKPHKADSADLQGSWTGQEADAKGLCSFVLNGSSFEFHGADPQEWYKATFSVYDTNPRQFITVITDCPFPAYVGQTSYGIYKLEDGTLTITGNEPGNPIVPANFDAQGARKVVFQHK